MVFLLNYNNKSPNHKNNNKTSNKSDNSSNKNMIIDANRNKDKCIFNLFY